jgi:type IV pilus assembly protein PilZ
MAKAAATNKKRQSILNVNYMDKESLYEAYIPYVHNGGIFVPTNTKYALGDEVFLLISLLEQEERIPVAGKVIWITPIGAEGNRRAGIGVQFSESDDQKAREIIETQLAGSLKSKKQTHTM